MGTSDIQVQFFQHVKNLLPPYKSLVDEVADLLEISVDSTYRRIRGEKYIDLEEIKKISQHFKISLDQVFNLESSAIVFHGKLNSFTKDSFGDWMEDTYRQLQLVYSQKEKHIYYLVKDMPPFYQFFFPELASFKFFFWLKSILSIESLKDEKFSKDLPMMQPLREFGLKIVQLYNIIPTTEVWNEEGINVTLKQIMMYYEMGFITLDDARLLLNQSMEIVNHLEKMAESGKKFNIGKAPGAESAQYNMFVNEMVIGDNTFMAKLDHVRVTYLNHSVMYFIGSMDQKFNDAMFSNLDNLIKKSTLISSVGEKDRTRFFNSLRKKIQEKSALLD